MNKKNGEIQNESHDWLGEAAEALVRYCFAKRGFYAYGAGKWGSDCILQHREEGNMFSVEVKSTDGKKSLKRSLIKKLNKMLEERSRPDSYAEVRVLSENPHLDREKGRIVFDMKVHIVIQDIDKKKKQTKPIEDFSKYGW